MLKFDIKCLFMILVFSWVGHAVIRPILIEGCQVVGTKNQCIKCELSYHLIQKVCIKLLRPISRISQVNSNEAQAATPRLVNTEASIRVNGSATQKSDTSLTVVKQEQNRKTQPTNAVAALLVGCMEQSNGVCLRCAYRYYNLNGACKEVSGLCREWNQQNGACTTCYEGYKLSSRDCVVKQVVRPSAGCMEQGEEGCLKCAYRYFNLNGYCKEVSGQCREWNEVNGACTSCYGGYIISQNDCVIDNGSNSIKSVATQSGPSSAMSTQSTPLSDSQMIRAKEDPPVIDISQLIKENNKDESNQTGSHLIASRLDGQISSFQVVAKPVLLTSGASAVPVVDLSDFSIQKWLDTLSSPNDTDSAPFHSSTGSE